MATSLSTVYLWALCFLGNNIGRAAGQHLPLLLTTWNYTDAVKGGWEVLTAESRSPLDAVETVGSYCELHRCRLKVGHGGSPDERGETTLDAMIMDGRTHNVGAVGGLRRINQAISVARKVLDNTDHSMLVGDQAVEFAVMMGFKEENLTTNYSRQLWQTWKAGNCQPNFRQNVTPDPRKSCGPYRPDSDPLNYVSRSARAMNIGIDNHDTIGIIAIDKGGNIASGTSTNGLKFKIPGLDRTGSDLIEKLRMASGKSRCLQLAVVMMTTANGRRVGDSPVPGAGSYADNDIGAAVCTGNGDIMMRFLPSYQAVTLMGSGMTPEAAAETAVNTILKKYPDFAGAVVAANKFGQFGKYINPYTARGIVSQMDPFQDHSEERRLRWCTSIEHYMSRPQGHKWGAILEHCPRLSETIRQDAYIQVSFLRDHVLTTSNNADGHLLARVRGILFDPPTDLPLVLTTWNYREAVTAGWESIYTRSGSAIDAVEVTGNYCDVNQCRHTVGFGGSPDESGETTLDAMIMDGKTNNVGAVGALRRIKRAIAVARKVLENTEHTLLVGDQATSFAVGMGFKEENLTTNYSRQLWQEWKLNQCQPNFRNSVSPDPLTYCGPYSLAAQAVMRDTRLGRGHDIGVDNHDTIGIVAITGDGNIASGTTTNGLGFKIPGRVGDSPIAGAGSYADNDMGAAACTGNGDIMMRFLPSYHAVMLMGTGSPPTQAARQAIDAILRKYPHFRGGVVAANKFGQYGAACHKWTDFSITARNPTLKAVSVFNITCTTN